MHLKRRSLPVCAMILILTGCSQSPQAREARYLEKGKKEFERKNYSVAVLHFKNAMVAQPRDAEPYYQLGLSYLGSNDVKTAGAYFQKSTELNPKHAGAQLKLAELMATSNNKEIVEEAERRTQGVLTLLPEDTEALNILASTELRLGKPDSAEAHLQQALRKSPNNLRSSVALAQTRLARKDVAGAEEALKQAAAQSPKSPDPRVYLGELFLALGRTAEAEQEYRRALEIDPKHGPALLALGAMQLRAGQMDKAEAIYRRVAALPDKQYKAAHALYLFQSGKGDQAIAEFETLAKSDPGNRTLRTDLVKAYLALNRVGDAEKVLTAALKKNGLDTDAMLQRSRIYLASGKYAEAQADLNQVLHYHDNSSEAHYLLSKVQQGRRDTALQQQELGQALRLDPAALDARLELAQALIADGGAQSALKLLDEAPQEQKATARVDVQRNWALLVLGRIAEARKGIDHVLAAGKVPEALLQDSELKLTQKDYAGARVSSEQVLEQAPENVPALNVLVQSYRAQNQLPAGLKRAREQAAKQPNSDAIQQYLGQLLVTNGDRAGARAAFEAAKAAKPRLFSADLALAEMDIGEAKWDEARKRLTSVLSSQPDNLPAHLLFGQLEMTQAKTAAAIEQFRKAVSLDERNIIALNALAYMLGENKQPDEALKYAQKAKELAPGNAAVDDTLGWTYFQKGMYTLAVTYLRDATAKEGTARRRYHLAMAYLKAGDPKRGRETLDAALKMDPNIPEAQEARRAFTIGAN
jgi:tetratricopeptide (TPR) repeat protein